MNALLLILLVRACVCLAEDNMEQQRPLPAVNDLQNTNGDPSMLMLGAFNVGQDNVSNPQGITEQRAWPVPEGSGSNTECSSHKQHTTMNPAGKYPGLEPCHKTSSCCPSNGGQSCCKSQCPCQPPPQNCCNKCPQPSCHSKPKTKTQGFAAVTSMQETGKECQQCS